MIILIYSVILELFLFAFSSATMQMQLAEVMEIVVIE